MIKYHMQAATITDDTMFYNEENKSAMKSY